jgi:hypothetical protein
MVKNFFFMSFLLGFVLQCTSPNKKSKPTVNVAIHGWYSGVDTMLEGAATILGVDIKPIIIFDDTISNKTLEHHYENQYYVLNQADSSRYDTLHLIICESYTGLQGFTPISDEVTIATYPKIYNKMYLSQTSLTAATFVHELGHLAGLQHSWQDDHIPSKRQCINYMNYTTCPLEFTPQQSIQVNTYITKLYH